MLQSFQTHPIQTNYSTLDLVNWTKSSRWSEPKPISEHQILSQDKTLKDLISFNLIQDKVRTIFNWVVSKTLFLVTEPYVPGVYNYHMIDTKDICNQSYHFSPDHESENKFFSLNEALGGSVVSPLDLCYIKDKESQVLFCFGNLSFQANLVQNDPLHQPLTGPLETLPIATHNMTVDRLRDIGRLVCSVS